MNRAKSKSPSRKRGSSTGRKPRSESKGSSSEPRRSKRDRSKSRGRTTEVELLKAAMEKVTKEKRPKTPTRGRSPGRPRKDAESSTPKAVISNDFRSSATRESASTEKSDIQRSSMSRVDEIMTEVRKTRSQTSKVLNEFNEESEREIKKLQVAEEKKPNKEFGGLIGALLITVLLPIVGFLLQFVCSKDSCSVKGFKIPLILSKYLDWKASAIYIGFLGVQAILTALPIGPKASGIEPKFEPLPYRCNGFINLLVSFAILGGLWYSGFNLTAYIDNTVHFLSTAIAIAFLLSIIIYLRGLKQSETNLLAGSGSHIYDFFIGRQVSPRIGSFDLKMFILKSSIIGTIIYNALVVLLYYETNKTVSLTLATAVLLPTWYLLDFLAFESSYLSSFVIQHEGLGYAFIMSCALFPFFMGSLPEFILYNRVEDNYYTIVASLLLHLTGYCILRISNRMKTEIRRSSGAAAKYSIGQTMSTISGKKLLVSGLWSKVRHPNYLGAILMYWAWWIPTLIFTPLHWVTLFPPAFITIFFVHRSIRDSSHCSFRHGAVWDRYITKVRYHLVPKVL